MDEKDYVFLLKELKLLKNSSVGIPLRGHHRLYEAESQKTVKGNGQEYIIVIRRGRINFKKCTFHAYTKDTKVGLLRLDIGASPHKNPDGSIITGDHLHVYKEGLELTDAISFDVAKTDLIDSCIWFLKEFKIIDVDSIEITQSEQLQLFN